MELYSTGNDIQFLVITCNGKESGLGADIPGLGFRALLDHRLPSPRLQAWTAWVSMETHQPQGGVTPWRQISASAYPVKVSSARGANGASDGCVLAGRREHGDGPRGLYSLYQSKAELAVMDRRSGKRPRVRAFTQPAGRSAENGPMRRRRGWGEETGCSGSGGRG